MERIQVLLDPEEKERFRRLAHQRGISLSAWLREAALQRSAQEGGVSRLRSREALRAFFAECDARETGREPEWGEHIAVLEASKRAGAGEPSAALERGESSRDAVGNADGARTERGGGGARSSRRASSRKRR